MDAVLFSIIPVFGIIWLGYLFKIKNFPHVSFWPMVEKFTYYWFLPCLFFQSVQQADFAQFENLLPLFLAVTGAMLATSATAFLAQKLIFKMPSGSFASYFQGSVRFNNYIGIPIILAFFGDEGLVIYAIIIGLAIPLSTALTVTIMNHYAAQARLSIKRQIYAIVKNPLIIGSLAGVIVNITQTPLFYLGTMIGLFAAAAPALGLLTVGAAIDFRKLRGQIDNITATVAMRILVSPAYMFLFCLWLGVEGKMRDVALVYAALPIAITTYILSKEHGADGELMAGATILSTILSMFTLKLLLFTLN